SATPATSSLQVDSAERQDSLWPKAAPSAAAFAATLLSPLAASANSRDKVWPDGPGDWAILIIAVLLCVFTLWFTVAKPMDKSMRPGPDM
ncbi:unnamed protein product, partial [Polarella glacialis]